MGGACRYGWRAVVASACGVQMTVRVLACTSLNVCVVVFCRTNDNYHPVKVLMQCPLTNKRTIFFS